jgi:hypothetical protein
MYKSAPQTNVYDTISLLQRTKKVLFWSIIILSVLTSLKTAGWLTPSELISDLISMFHIISILGFTAISIIIDYILIPNGQKTTRNDFFDHSFGTKYIVHKNSEEYYTNQDLPNGFYKMSVNLFESIFFTYSIACGMRLKRIFTTSVLILVLIPLLYYGIKNTSFIFIALLQTLVSAYFLGGLIRLIIFANRNESLFTELSNIFSTNEFKNKIDEYSIPIIKIYTDYESNKAWSNILLDSKLYKKMNADLSHKWIEIKKKYNISNNQ